MSIRGRLLTGLLLSLIGLYVAAGLTMFVSARALLQRQFDATLAAKAEALASLIRLTPGGRVTIEPLETLPAWNGASGSDLYEVWAEDGSALLRSPALEKNDLPRGQIAEAPRFAGAVLPGGASGRAVTFRLTPASDDEDEHDTATAAKDRQPSSTKTVVVAIAQDSRELDRFLSILLRASVLITVVASVGTVAVVHVVVRRGLRPLQDVAARAAQIDVQSLHIRFPIDGLPAELQPICLRLNASLEKLQQAFQRERRFTADAAHELRTPIAELRALADVALHGSALRGSASGPAAEYFQDARDIAVQMERIVSTLLALARCHAGTMNIVREPVDVSAVLMDGWRLNQSTAGARRVDARFEIPPRATVITDRTMLQSVLGNLLGNAAEYGTPGGTVVCKAEVEGEKLRVRVVNPSEGLEPDDIGHFFEPFWRKDASRTDGSHSGLGLTLVRAYAELLGGSVTAALTDGGSLCMAVELPVGKVETA